MWRRAAAAWRERPAALMGAAHWATAEPTRTQVERTPTTGENGSMFFTAFGPMRLDPQANPAARSIQSFGFMQSHKLERWVLGPRQDPLVFAVFRASSLELHEAGNIRLETKAYKCSLRPLVIKELTASQQLPWSPLHTQYALG